MRAVRSDFAFSRRSSLLAAKKTLAPAPTASEAMASPIPEEAPVMRSTFPAKGSVVEEAMRKTDPPTLWPEGPTQFQNFLCGNTLECLRTADQVPNLGKLSYHPTCNWKEFCQSFRDRLKLLSPSLGKSGSLIF